MVWKPDSKVRDTHPYLLNDHQLKVGGLGLRLKVANAAKADRNASRLAFRHNDCHWLPSAILTFASDIQTDIPKKERMLEAVRLEGGGLRPGGGS